MKRKVPDRIRVRRGPKKGRYDRAAIEAVLDRGLFGHLAFADGAQPICIPMLHARVGDTLYIHGSTASRAVRALSGGAAACLTVTMLEGLVLALRLRALGELRLGPGVPLTAAGRRPRARRRPTWRLVTRTRARGL
jgi:hypothetical protein